MSEIKALAVLYSLDHFRKSNLEELYKYIHEGPFDEGCREVHKLVLMVLTIHEVILCIEKNNNLYEKCPGSGEIIRRDNFNRSDGRVV